MTRLRRPGGNLTGLTNLAQELGAKRLQLLKEAFPRVTHAVVLLSGAATHAFTLIGYHGKSDRLSVRV